MHSIRAVKMSDCALCARDAPSATCEACERAYCTSCIERRGPPYASCSYCAGELSCPRVDDPEQLRRLLRPWGAGCTLRGVWRNRIASLAPAPADCPMPRIHLADALSVLRCSCGRGMYILDVNLSEPISLACDCGRYLCAICSHVAYSFDGGCEHARDMHGDIYVSAPDFLAAHRARIASAVFTAMTITKIDRDELAQLPADLQPDLTTVANRCAYAAIFQLLGPTHRVRAVADTLALRPEAFRAVNGDSVLAQALADSSASGTIRFNVHGARNDIAGDRAALADACALYWSPSNVVQIALPLLQPGAQPRMPVDLRARLLALAVMARPAGADPLVATVDPWLLLAYVDRSRLVHAWAALGCPVAPAHNATARDLGCDVMARATRGSEADDWQRLLRANLGLDRQHTVTLMRNGCFGRVVSAFEPRGCFTGAQRVVLHAHLDCALPLYVQTNVDLEELAFYRAAERHTRQRLASSEDC